MSTESYERKKGIEGSYAQQKRHEAVQDLRTDLWLYNHEKAAKKKSHRPPCDRCGHRVKKPLVLYQGGFWLCLACSKHPKIAEWAEKMRAGRLAKPV